MEARQLCYRAHRDCAYALLSSLFILVFLPAFPTRGEPRERPYAIDRFNDWNSCRHALTAG